MQAVGTKQIQRIGLFDSGVGGLSVLRQLQRLPYNGKREFFYVGDTARCPYGNRERAEIARFVEQIVRFLLMRDVDAVVMACNTSAALALEVARSVSKVPVFDLITPTAKHVAGLGAKVGVIATGATARSHAFARAIQSINPACEVFELGCPDLVPLVEAGNADLPATLEVLEHHISKLIEQRVEALVLGCTHFPFLRRQIESLLQGRMVVIDPAEVLFSESALNSPMNVSSEFAQRCEFFVTGCPENFAEIAKKCMGELSGTVTAITADHLNELAASEVAADILVSRQAVTSPVVP